ncbi:MAG: hypothetical protein U0176_15315 [Bacteroidia bacterium]
MNRGMLMFYNMGELDDPKEDTYSILNVAEGAKYIDHAAMNCSGRGAAYLRLGCPHPA